MTRLRIAGAALLLALCTLGAARAAAPTPASIDTYVAALFQRSHLPGMAVTIVHGDNPTYARGFGDDGKGGAVTPDTPFILGSTSKSFTALAILQLAEAGRVSLDAPASRYLPGFLHGAPAAQAVTVRSLLNQVSGISHEAGNQPVINAGPTGPNPMAKFALGLTGDSLDRTPGASFEYSNANFVVLGAIVEAVSGQTYAAYLHEHVFAPLGMTRSMAEESPHLARGHKQLFGINYVADLPYPPSFVPAGFIVSTGNDLAKYLSAQLPGSANARRLGISDADIALWHRGAIATDPDGKGHYAMGWATDTFNGVPVIWHSGDTGVFSSEFVLEPHGDWGVVVLADGSGWLPQDYLQEISSGIVNLEVGRTPRDDTRIHSIVLAVYAAVLAIPLFQLLAVWRTWRRNAGWFGRIWPVALHLLASAALILALPGMLLGIPFTEMLTSFPDMAAAAIMSGLLTLIAVVRAFSPR